MKPSPFNVNKGSIKIAQERCFKKNFFSVLLLTQGDLSVLFSMINQITEIAATALGKCVSKHFFSIKVNFTVMHI